MKQKYEIICEESRKKSELNASCQYDYYKLCEEHEGLLSCQSLEEKESVHFRYDITGKKEFVNLREEKKQNRILALLNLIEHQELSVDYKFSIADSNLFYDRNFRTYIKSRDIYEKGEACDAVLFLMEFKALVGALLQKKYSFEDYYDGGLELLTKNKFLKPIYKMESVEQIYDYLEKEYETILEDEKNNKVQISRKWYQSNKYIVTALTILTVFGVGFAAYYLADIKPTHVALLTAEECYMDSDYIGVINALKEIEVSKLNKYQKMILATAYVRSENLTQEQKETILEKITVDGEEKVKDYWIYLGRLNTDEAVNIAMQRSDDEMLLYAYLKQQALLQKNTMISGEEKKEQLAVLEEKIEKLAEKYEEDE